MSPHSIRIPASTSNLGAGFDALSLALNEYLNLRIEAADDFSIEAHGVSVDCIPTGPENLIARVAKRVAAQRRQKLPPFRMSIHNEIPLARGLGSSAAAIVAGITCYELMAGDRLTDTEIFRSALEFEPHPDNLAAALYGGLVAAAVSPAGEVMVAKLKVVEGSQPLVVIPEFELSTEKARAILPASYSRSDTVFNIQRTALTIAALTTGRWPLLREAMRDRVHEPYRAELIPGLAEILNLKCPGLLGIALSGAGPSVFAFAEPAGAAAVGEVIADIFAKYGVQATPHAVQIDTEGRRTAS